MCAVAPCVVHVLDSAGRPAFPLSLQAFKDHLVFAGGSMVHALCDRALRPEVLRRLDGKSMSRMIWAYGKIGLCKAEFIRGIGERMAGDALLHTLNAQDVSMTLWGLARLRSADAWLVDALTGRIAYGAASLGEAPPAPGGAVSLLSTFNAQDVANTVWALATLGVEKPVLMVALADHVVRTAPALAVMHTPPPPCTPVGR